MQITHTTKEVLSLDCQRFNFPTKQPIMTIINTLNNKLVGSWITFLVLYVSLIVFSIIYGASEKQWIFHLTFMILGSALGWIVGTIASPYSSEKEEFSAIVKAISVFISGYALAKIDPLITEFLKKENLNDNTLAFRSLVFICSFLLTLVFTFITRKYYRAV
jgi:hypothetical protein